RRGPGAPLTPQGNLEARLEYEPVPRRCRAEADADTQLGVVSELQVHAWIKLVHLLAAGQRTAEQAALAVVLDAQSDHLAHRHPHATTRLELPLRVPARIVLRERALDHRIELELPSPDPLFKDRANLEPGSALVVGRRRELQLAAESGLMAIHLDFEGVLTSSQRNGTHGCDQDGRKKPR